MEFKTELKRELNQTKLRLWLPELYREDYQVRMIRENSIQGLLVMSVHGEGEETIYEYDITELISLSAYYKQKKITDQEMREFLKQVQKVIEEMENYLLNPNKLLMQPDYIFFWDGIYGFCYFPGGDEDIRSSFHRLMDDFVKWTDYQDIASVKTAFLLHKETMKENYSLTKIMKKLEEAREKEAVEQMEKKGKQDTELPQESANCQEQLWQQGEYDSAEHDWITRQELGSKILKETDNLWNPVKRLLNRRKRPKWGDWDGIYINEEEL